MPISNDLSLLYL